MRRQILNAADAGDGDRVLNRLRARMATEPSNVALRLELAAYYRKIGLPEIQMEHLQLAVERFPESSAARMALAQALRAASLPWRAAESLDDFARVHPQSADAEMLNLLGICYDEAEDFKAGEQAFGRALALAPRLDYLHNNLGYNLLEQHREVEAVSAFRQALKVNPDSILARNNLGVALARASLQDPRMTVADALAHFQNVVDTATAYNNVAAAMMEQNRYEESRRLLEAALDYNRSHAAALANLRMVAAQDGKPLELRPAARHGKAVIASTSPAAVRIPGVAPPREEVATARAPEQTRVGGNFQEPRLISGPPPQMPLLAKERRIYGAVKLEATISKDGTVKHVNVLGGHPFLTMAARDAALKRSYRPALLNGEPFEVKVPIQMVFEPGR